MRPSVLIMMSTYNGEKYVSEQIESILAQQHVDITLAIRDDGSNDTTLHILNDYAAKHPNISVTAGDNIGYAASFWTLLMQADTSYDYYAFADQDDLWDANKIAAAIFAIKKTDNPLTLYTSALRVVDENLTIYQHFSKTKANAWKCHHKTSFIRLYNGIFQFTSSSLSDN